jgi:hypothetical protein
MCIQGNTLFLNETENEQNLFFCIGDHLTGYILKDTFKNLEHTTDFLATILYDYKDCNIATVNKLPVPTGHIINDKLIFMKYKTGNSSLKWSVVEIRSCSAPFV